eukprot:8262997-Pyramimonas_sp.AAC.1
MLGGQPLATSRTNWSAGSRQQTGSCETSSSASPATWLSSPNSPASTEGALQPREFPKDSRPNAGQGDGRC